MGAYDCSVCDTISFLQSCVNVSLNRVETNKPTKYGRRRQVRGQKGLMGGHKLYPGRRGIHPGAAR